MVLATQAAEQGHRYAILPACLPFPQFSVPQPVAKTAQKHLLASLLHIFNGQCAATVGQPVGVQWKSEEKHWELLRWFVK